MKLSTFATLLTALPFVSAAGLKGQRQLQCVGDPTDPDGACFADRRKPGMSDEEALAQGYQIDGLPGLDELIAAYTEFCAFCANGTIVNADAIFCGVCDTIPPDSLPAAADLTQCFSETSTVQVESGATVALKDLKLGAKVLTGSGAYEPVYAWGHKNPTRSAEFLQFNTGSSNLLEMTAAHLVFLDGKFVRADSVKVGDVLQGEATVLAIQVIQRQGLYSPLTPSGTVVVDGIVASSYISLQNSELVQLQGGISTFVSWQDLVHVTLSPFRMLRMGTGLGNAYTEEGIPLYASAGMDLLQWLNRQHIVVQVVAMVVAFCVFGACFILENTFGAASAPMAVVGAGALVFIIKNSGFALRARKIKSV